jgi:hypothetical protein
MEGGYRNHILVLEHFSWPAQGANILTQLKVFAVALASLFVSAQIGWFPPLFSTVTSMSLWRSKARTIRWLHFSTAWCRAVLPPGVRMLMTLRSWCCCDSRINSRKSSWPFVAASWRHVQPLALLQYGASGQCLRSSRATSTWPPNAAEARSGALLLLPTYPKDGSRSNKIFSMSIWSQNTDRCMGVLRFLSSSLANKGRFSIIISTMAADQRTQEGQITENDGCLAYIWLIK